MQKKQHCVQVSARTLDLLRRQVSGTRCEFPEKLSNGILQRRWRGELEAPRGFFSLPLEAEKGVWELFFEVRVVGTVGTQCQQGKLTVAHLVAGEESPGDKLLLREGKLGIQVEPFFAED